MSKFRNSNGAYYTKSLFYETNVVDPSLSVYTLKAEDHKGYPSLKRLWFETGDITGYKLSQAHLENWEHLCKLKECQWFIEYWDAWEREFEIKLRSEALVNLTTEAKNKESKSYVELNKFLLNRGWVLPEDKKPTRKRGAPSKAEVREQAIHLARDDETVASDLLRVTKGTFN